MLHSTVRWLFIAILLLEYNYAQQNELPDCEWCGANEAPENLSWQTTIADEKEDGERLIITGTVFNADEKTPAPRIIIYFYHTNNNGIYPKRGNETGNGKRHGYLRGWIKTNEEGKYKINTIKPAPYPGRTSAAHIHTVVKEPDKDEYWIDSIIFEGDPLITPEYKNQLKNRGGSGIVKLNKKEETWYGTRNIFLK